jgi:hypothetical protein
MGVIFRALEIGGISSFPKFNDHQKENIFVHRYKNMKDIVMISGKRQNHCTRGKNAKKCKEKEQTEQEHRRAMQRAVSDAI